MVTVGVELNSRPGRDGRFSVLLRITHNRKSARLNTGVRISKKDFNPNPRNFNYVRTSENYYNKYNDDIKDLHKELETFGRDVLAKDVNLVASEIMEAFKRRNETRDQDWIKYFEEVVKHYHAVGKVRFSIRINAICRKLQDYIGDGNTVLLSDTNLKWLKGFEEYLFQKKNNSVNTVAGNLKVIKQIYKSAIDDGLVENPDLKVLGYSIKMTSVERDKLDVKEIKAIEELELEGGLGQIRDFFMFSYYGGGIRFSDCAMLRWKDLDGEYLKYRMSKNSKLQSITLQKPAWQIIERQREITQKHKSPFIFGWLPKNFEKLDKSEQVYLLNTANAVVNKHLKSIARMAKIRKNVSMHTARHSFAYNGFKKTKDVLAMQQILRHSDLKETQNYITSLSNEEDRDILGEIFS